MPLSVVVDASFVLAMIVPHPKEAAAQRVYDELSAAAAVLIAPTLWLYEVASGIQKLTFFGRISASQAEESLRLAEAFKIVFVTPDYELVRRAIAWSQRLQRANAYDSFYLALAEAHGCDLWIADSKLVNAARVP